MKTRINVFLIFFSVLASILILSSCKKCMTCSFRGANSTFNSGETCGSKAYLDQIKMECETKAKTAGVICDCR